MQQSWNSLVLASWGGFPSYYAIVAANNAAIAVTAHANVHTYCQRCNRYFVSSAALEQHKASSPGVHITVCNSCDRTFKTQQALKHHYISSAKHAFCEHCDRHFGTGLDLESHYLSAHIFCPFCRQFFDSDDILNDHACQRCWYCVECMRVFNNQQSLNTHLRASKLHNELVHACPGRGCVHAFVSYSDLLQHLESGACCSKVRRTDVNNLAVRLDRGGVITNPSRLLMDPSGTLSVPQPIVSYATVQSFNGTAYECVLCHRSFATLPRLNSHLDSPAHDEEIYHCPTAHDGCGAEFKTLSGLLQHMESECCDVRKFQNQVNKTLDVLTARMGRIAL